MLRLLVLVITLLTINSALAQLAMEKAYYSRFVVPEGIDAEVTQWTVDIDTLIMEDNSSLLFKFPEHALRIKYAYVRGDVKWKGAGTEGEQGGGRGNDGADLDVEVTFYELGRLIIDTRGGAGSNGKSPTTKRGYYTMEPAGNGGNGGDGGDVRFIYKCIGFTPRFDSGKKNAVHIKTKGGSGGNGGFENRSSNLPKTASGPQGKVGNKGRDGLVEVKEM
ncbi:MAG: hypothetical protein JNK10_13810 [Cyclobacteriaceae bacterium]|nr:hypothetical protein [Cyclobacteriaceae bacterium]